MVTVIDVGKQVVEIVCVFVILGGSGGEDTLPVRFKITPLNVELKFSTAPTVTHGDAEPAQ